MHYCSTVHCPTVHCPTVLCPLSSAGQHPQFLPNGCPHPPANALVDFVKNQGGRGVRVGKDTFERQHQTRCFTARSNLCQRLKRFARVGADHEFHLINACTVK